MVSFEPNEASVKLEVDHFSWIDSLADDAKEAIKPWEEEKGDVSTENSKKLITFFLVSNTYLESLATDIILEEGIVSTLEKESNESNLKNYEDIMKDTTQYNRECTLEEESIFNDSVLNKMENTRWIRNKMAHNPDAYTKRTEIDKKFNKNNTQFKPRETIEHTVEVVVELESYLDHIRN